jgi:hypothetical protein
MNENAHIFFYFPSILRNWTATNPLRLTSFGLLRLLVGGKPLKPKRTVQLVSRLFAPRSSTSVYTEKLLRTCFWELPELLRSTIQPVLLIYQKNATVYPEAVRCSPHARYNHPAAARACRRSVFLLPLELAWALPRLCLVVPTVLAEGIGQGRRKSRSPPTSSPPPATVFPVHVGAVRPSASSPTPPRARGWVHGSNEPPPPPPLFCSL